MAKYTETIQQDAKDYFKYILENIKSDELIEISNKDEISKADLIFTLRYLEENDIDLLNGKFFNHWDI